MLTVVLNPFGLGDKIANLELFIFGKSSENNSLVESAVREPIKTETVHVTTAAQYCADLGISNIYFLKIDVEGYDLAVLRGALTLFEEQRITLAQFEYGSTWIAARSYIKDVIDMFNRLPYSLWRITPYGLVRIPKYVPSLDDFEHANYLLVHNNFPITELCPISRK